MDEWRGLGGWVLEAACALLTFGRAAGLLKLVHLADDSAVVGKPDSDVVEPDVGVDELTLGVQEVEGEEGVLQDLLGEGESEARSRSSGSNLQRRFDSATFVAG